MQARCLRAGAIGAEERRVRRLAAVGVDARLLAELLDGALDVENVVYHLKRQAQSSAVVG